MTVVLVRHDLPIAAAIRERRPALEVIEVADREVVLEALPRADVFVTNPTLWDDAFLDALDAGDWVQTTSAGYAAFPLDAFQERGIAFANAGDLHSETVAEHAFTLLLAINRDLPGFLEDQRRHRWDRSELSGLTDLAGDSLTVLGLGNIGEAVARRALAFEMTVTGVKRDPEDYDGCLAAGQVVGPAGLPPLLPETDVLVCCVPLTDDTRGLVDASILEALPETAVLVNVSRGPVVDTDALLAALDAGALGAAGLDVFETEPLPTDSPLWDRDDVLITPHVAGRSNAFVPRFIDLFAANLQAWESGTPLRNELAGI